MFPSTKVEPCPHVFLGIFDTSFRFLEIFSAVIFLFKNIVMRRCGSQLFFEMLKLFSFELKNCVNLSVKDFRPRRLTHWYMTTSVVTLKIFRKLFWVSFVIVFLNN